jgi:XTP/dITP diphosphohydrolase
MLNLMKILLASNNLHKRTEFNRILTGHTLITPRELGIPFEVPEEGTSFLDNALLKARALFAKTGQPVLADDSGLCVAALGGEPGVHSARYGALDVDTKQLKASLPDHDRNNLLLANLQNITDRQAFFVCCLVLLVAEYRFFVVQETLAGVIALQPEGKDGFGYDPIFFLPELGKTIAELSGDQKDRLSHRGRATQHLLTIINSL